MEFSEHIRTANVEDVVLRGPLMAPSRGTLCITAHHLLFSGREEGGAPPLLLLLRNIDAVEKRASGSSGTITIKCKDLRVLHLDVPGMEQCLNIARSIETLSCLDSVADAFPFFYRPSDLRLQAHRGPSAVEEYYHQTEELRERWRLSSVNRDFSVCPSYPPVVIVPSSVGDEELKKAAMFRQGGRFPVLSYYHRKNGTVILRSSAPLPGASGGRCGADEGLLRAALGGSDRGFVIDTRSAPQGLQNRLSGGAGGATACYPGWRRLHRPMERGRGLQQSLARLVEACGDPNPNPNPSPNPNPVMERWLGRLNGSRWLSHVQTALSTAGLLAECLERDGHSALVSGGGGTDCTLLLTSLAQLIVDPRCRTLEGFLALLDREWLQAGHPFQQRCARGALSHARPQQEAPVFLLLLDCVWQLLHQFPLALGFSEGLLLRLASEAYASDYGTFLCNSEKERAALGLRDRTHCLFGALLRDPEPYSNPLFQPTELAIWPSVHPQALELWTGYFLRWTPTAQHLQEVQREIRTLVSEWGRL